jgi:hypothetical protein
MKLTFRVAAFTLVVAAAVAGNHLPKRQTIAAVHQTTPVPMCNPFKEPCPKIR